MDLIVFEGDPRINPDRNDGRHASLSPRPIHGDGGSALEPVAGATAGGLMNGQTVVISDIGRWPLPSDRKGRRKQLPACFVVSTGASSLTHTSPPLVGIVMGSKSDWPTMKMAAEVLEDLQIPHERRVVSAHRTPQWMAEYAETAESRGIRLIIAGAGGAAHLPGMIASQTALPVIGVPVQSRALSGLDSLLSIVQMPGGVPVATMAIGEAGAKNAGLFAARVLALHDETLKTRLKDFITAQQEKVMEDNIL